MVCYPGINHSLGYWRNCCWFCKKSKILSVRFYFDTQMFIGSGNTELTFLLSCSYFSFIHTYWYECSNLTFASLAQFASLFPLIDKVSYTTIAAAEIINCYYLKGRKMLAECLWSLFFPQGTLQSSGWLCCYDTLSLFTIPWEMQLLLILKFWNC